MLFLSIEMFLVYFIAHKAKTITIFGFICKNLEISWLLQLLQLLLETHEFPWLLSYSQSATQFLENV